MATMVIRCPKGAAEALKDFIEGYTKSAFQITIIPDETPVDDEERHFLNALQEAESLIKQAKEG